MGKRKSSMGFMEDEKGRKQINTMIDLSFYNGKKVFITGHTGFKGSWLCRILLNAGANITGYSLKPSANNSLFDQLNLEKQIYSIIADITDTATLSKAVVNSMPEIIFHLAAQPLVRASYQDPSLTYMTNVMGTVNILEAARLAPLVRSFVNVTTDKVYENREWNWGYREIENLCGFDPYSNSKSCSELITYSYRNSFFQGINSPSLSTARSGNVIGGGDYSENRIIPDCIRAAISGSDIILRNPNSTRPYQYILDTLYGYLLLAEKQYSSKKIAGAYNFGPNEENNLSNSELAQIFCDNWGSKLSWITNNDQDSPHEANYLKLDSSKSRSVLGWRPQINIINAVKNIIEFAKCSTNEERAACIDRQIKEYFIN